ncbi:hypothetical protein [Thermogemmatispora aurantia]|uniref:hypothetical protein n=1 Tax=Thermogemmatispora aurantia TaxID=2045279 RepID=UPI00124C33D7|nr:hypothetical protein [Thermogemmatispora aurantia]
MSAIQERFDRYDLLVHRSRVVGWERLVGRVRRLRECLLAQEEELLPVLLETLAEPPRRGSATTALELLQEMALPAQVAALPAVLNHVGDRNNWAWLDAATFLQRVPVEELVPHVIAALLWPWEPYHERYTTGKTTWEEDVYGIQDLLLLPGMDRGVVRGCVEVIYCQLLCDDLWTCRSRSWREGERLYWLEMELEQVQRLLRELPEEGGAGRQEERLMRLLEPRWVERGAEVGGQEGELGEMVRELGSVGKERGTGLAYVRVVWELEEERMREGEPAAGWVRPGGRELGVWLRVLERVGVEPWMAPALVEVVRRYPQAEEGEVARRLLGRLPKEELRAYRLILEQSGLGELGS